MKLSVIIVTLNRPDCIRRCLGCIFSQDPKPNQVIVVDASSDNSTEHAVSHFPDVLYLRTDVGFGHMTASRNLGISHCTGDIIAFIDDDAFPHPDWTTHLLLPYLDPAVGAVGGRALNNQPGEATHGVDEIGRLKSNGTITGNFAADSGKIIEVDHIIGCNMSYRRRVIEELGGLREEYPGTEVREETDICLRVKRLGYKILFNPLACVDHIGAPQAKGKRFDTRYAFYSAHNHLVLLIRNFGLLSGIVWRYVFYSTFAFVLFPFIKQVGAAAIKFLVVCCGTVAGLASGILLLARTGSTPLRHGLEADRLRQALQANLKREI